MVKKQEAGKNQGKESRRDALKRMAKLGLGAAGLVFISNKNLHVNSIYDSYASHSNYSDYNSHSSYSDYSSYVSHSSYSDYSSYASHSSYSDYSSYANSSRCDDNGYASYIYSD